MFFEFSFLLLVERHLLGDGNRSTDLEITTPYGFGFPARTPQRVGFYAHVGRDGIVVREHVGDFLLK